MRKCYSLLILIGSILFLAGAAAAQSVGEVSVAGNERIEMETVLLQTSLKGGMPFSQERLSEDIKKIYKTGYFEKVAVRTQPRGGLVDILFVVQEKPAIRNVVLDGNEAVNDETLKEKLNLGARRFLDRSKIRASIEQARLYYQGLGYYDSEIDFTETPAERNQVDLTFKVKEGDKKVVREVVFEGNKAFSESELLDVVRIRPHFWLTSWITGRGIVKREQLEADMKELLHFYLTKGYVDARVVEPEIASMTDGLRVTFKVTEGEVYTIGKLRASGTLLQNSQAKTLEGIQTQEGEVFDADKIRKDTFTVSEKFTDTGYAFTNVVPDTEVRRDQKKVDITFRIDKGNLISVDRINITGNKKTADNVIRRSLKVQEQEQFSSSKIRRSQELLQRLGYFDEVTITPEPSAERDKVDLNVAVREGNTGTFSIGAGISSGEGFIFQSQISENNVFGSGNSLSFDVNTGTRRENFVLSFDNPRVADSYMSFGADLMSIKRRYDDFDRQQVGGAVSVGYPIGLFGEERFEDVRGSLTYELTEVEIDNIDFDAAQLIRDEAGKSTSSSITPRLIRNTINNPLDPTGGSRQVAAVEIAGLGGDEEFWLLSAGNTFYYSMVDTESGPLVLAHRIRVNYGETYDDEPFPLFKRFFGGGINSVRGYSARELSPRDENGSKYGGSSELVNNLELIFPLINSIGLKGLLFFDSGNVYDDDESLGSELRHAVGFGVRWRSPIAPIRIEFGFPVGPKEEGTSGGLTTNFSFGNPQ